MFTQFIKCSFLQQIDPIAHLRVLVLFSPSLSETGRLEVEDNMLVRMSSRSRLSNVGDVLNNPLISSH